MKKLLLIFLVFISFASYGQRIQKANTYGLAFNRTGADTLFYLPSDTFTVPAAYLTYPFMARKGANVYIWNTSSNVWQGLTGGTLDTTGAFVTSVYRRSDSVFYVKGGVHTFAFKDSTGGSTPTLQQVLTAGSTLTGVNDIHLDGNEFRFLGGSGDFLVQDVNLIDLINDNDNGIQIGTAEGVLILPNLGVLKIDTINYTLSTTGKKVLIRDTATGLVQNIDPSLLGASSYTFTNGLTNSSGTVKLGGTMTEATTTLDGGTTSTLRFQDMIFDVTSSIITMLGDSISLTGGTSTNRSDIVLKNDTIKIKPGLGIAMIDTLAAASNMTNKKVMTWDTVTKRWEQISKDSVGGTGGTTSPAGNYGNLQINRNGAFATPASDSLIWASATGLTSLGNIGVGVTTSTHRVSILDNQTTRDVLKIRNLSASGYSSIGFFGYTDAQVGGFGYANAGIAGPVSDAIYFYSNSKDLVFSKDATATSSMTIRGATGTVGIVNAFIGSATGTATARLHISAGTATANTGAPFKLTSGTNLTTPEAGAMEYNGTNLFFTPSSAARNNILMTASVNSVSPTSPNRTITVVIDGTTYYIHAKTTND